jgi:hypothetical protein
LHLSQSLLPHNSISGPSSTCRLCSSCFTNLCVNHAVTNDYEIKGVQHWDAL